MKHFLPLALLLLLFTSRGIAQRHVQSLNSAWEFSTAEEPESSKSINIPHTWNAEDAFEGGKEYYRGKGIYQKTIYVPQEWHEKQVYLKFEGSNQVTSLYVNDKLVGEHLGGYTSFVFDLTPTLNPGKENTLRIEVDNSHNVDIPPLDADFNFYGGIYRDLWLVTTDKVHFEMVNEAAGNFLVKTPNVSEEKASIEVVTKIMNSTSKNQNPTVSIKIIDPQSKSIKKLRKKVALKPGETKQVVFEHEVQEPELWSPSNPNLYRVEAAISEESSTEPLDLLETRFGLRWFSVDPEQGFFLNGKPLKLIGANRHQDFKGLGNAVPNALHRKDYKMIKEMGANFIRTAHYPQDPEVYRICDELGLLVWSEVPVINDVTDSEAYHEVSLQMQREQILQFFNHPSVVIWGYMNEIFIRLVFNNNITEAQKEAKIATTVSLAEKLEKQTKQLDPQRLSAMALHENEIYNTTGVADFPDIIGWNLYFGWYSPGLESFGEFLDKQHKKYPDRPIMVSEYGPGADVRNQTNEGKPWDYSEAYQLKLHRSYLNQVQERDFVFGMTAWNFADFGSSFRQDALPYLNQKGLVNFDRSTKDAYHYYQARLLEEPMLYIAGKNFTERYVKDSEEEIEIKVFSNVPEVALSANGETYSSKVQDGIAIFNLPLPAGKTMLTATGGELSHSREFNIHYREQLLSRLDSINLLVNVGTHVQYQDPITSEVWIADQEYEVGGFGYVGGDLYQRSENNFQGVASNIQGTRNDPLFQTMRKGIEAYRFDVERGTYLVTLLFTEPEFNASEENIYNLTSAEKREVEGLRSFDININGETLTKDVNLARDYGRLRAVEISYQVKTDTGIKVGFKENAGSAVLSGIKIEKL